MNWAVNTEDRSFISRLNWERFLLVFWMRAGVNDPIHVQVQIVKFHLIGVWLCCINRNTNSIALLPLLTWKETKKITFFASELQLRTKIHLQLLWAALTQNLVTFLQTCMSGYSTDFRKLCDYAGYVCCRQFFTFVCNVYGKWLLWISMLVQKMPKIYNIYLQIQLKSWEQMICFCNRLQ